ncbi:MAG: hypothetical protein KDI19_08310 [Pseudomonadales bacterium]|nr:hypothetical protein [Pseudomonadales bacterium]
MAWVSYDPFRTRDFPNTTQLKAKHFFADVNVVRSASRVLFPEYWQVNALVFGLGSQIFPSHASFLLGYDKIEMYYAFRAVDQRVVPDTIIRPNTPRDAEETFDDMTLPFVAKLPRSAEGRGVWLIESKQDWREYLSRTDTLLAQEYLPIDRDARVVIVGGEPISAYWRLQSTDGFHNNIARGGLVGSAAVPTVAVDAAVTMARALGIDHGGFDVAVVGGRPYLLEFNRLFGNQAIAGGDAYVRARILAYLLGTSQDDDGGADPPLWPRAA